MESPSPNEGCLIWRALLKKVCFVNSKSAVPLFVPTSISFGIINQSMKVCVKRQALVPEWEECSHRPLAVGSKVQEEDPTPLCGKTSYSNISKTERVSSLLRLFFPPEEQKGTPKDRRDSECDPGAGPGSVPRWLYTLKAPKLFSLNWDITLVHLYGIQYHDLICVYNVWWSNRTISISMSSNINNFCML